MLNSIKDPAVSCGILRYPAVIRLTLNYDDCSYNGRVWLMGPTDSEGNFGTGVHSYNNDKKKLGQSYILFLKKKRA